MTQAARELMGSCAGKSVLGGLYAFLNVIFFPLEDSSLC